MYFYSFYRQIKSNIPIVNLVVSSSSLALQLQTIYKNKTKTEKKRTIYKITVSIWRNLLAKRPSPKRLKGC